jgi:Spy/CpxP family protein refolding chaperone
MNGNVNQHAFYNILEMLQNFYMQSKGCICFLSLLSLIACANKFKGGMKMKKSIISIFLVFIFISALVSNAHAQMCGCMGEKGGGMKEGGMMDGMGHQDIGMMYSMGGMHGGGMMMDDDHPMWKHLMSLGLDDKQIDALKALRSNTIKDMIKRRADKQIAGIELKDLLGKEPVDMKSVEASVRKNESLKAEMFLALIKAHEEMKSILTPDQRMRLKEIIKADHGEGCGMRSSDTEHKDMPMHEHMH